MGEYRENAKKVQNALNQDAAFLQPNPHLAQRVLANARKGERTVKYSIPKGAVIALIVLLCMSTVAVAAGVYGGAINWEGEIVSVEEADAAEGLIWGDYNTENEQQFAMLEELLKSYKQDGERVEITVREAGRVTGGLSSEVSRTADTMDVFLALMSEDSNLPIPAFLPDEYELVQAKVDYRCCEDGEWLLLECVELEGGITVERYGLEKEDELVRGYTMYCQNRVEKDTYLWIAVELMPEGISDKHYVRFDESDTPQIITVPGMDDALAIARKQEQYVYMKMRRKLAAPVGISTLDGDKKTVLGEIVVHIEAVGIDIDLTTLINMFATE